jgi:hypothetical protein
MSKHKLQSYKTFAIILGWAIVLSMTFRGNLPISWFVDRPVCDILTKGPSYIVKRGRYPLGKEYKQMSSTQTFLKELKRLLLKCMKVTSCSHFRKGRYFKSDKLAVKVYFQIHIEKHNGCKSITSLKN